MSRITILLITGAMITAMTGCSSRTRSNQGSGGNFQAIAESDLIRKKGYPKRIDRPSDAQSIQLYHYEARDTYQVEQNQVVAHHRAPKEGEETLQYWYHELKGKAYKMSPVEDRSVEAFAGHEENKHQHGPDSLQLVSEEAGVTVIYDPKADRVTQVIEYVAK